MEIEIEGLAVFEIVFIALFGLIFGSFLNVVIYRVPLEQSVVTPRSSCPNCGSLIKWYQNIPVISYILLKGKCANCSVKIPLQYPLVELITALLFVAIYFKNGLDLNYIFLALLFSLLLALSMIDLKYLAVPDSINLLAFLVSIFVSQNYLENITNALIMAGFFTMLRFYVSFALKKEAMGEGDITIGGMMGAVLGVELSFAAIFISALIALPFSIINRQIPYIPFLTSALLVTYLFDETILNIINKIYG